MPPDSEVNQEILQRLARVETKLDMMTSARDLAFEAHQSTKAAHHRLDEMRGEIAGMKQGQKWMVGTTISLIGLFVAVVGFLFKIAGGAN